MRSVESDWDKYVGLVTEDHFCIFKSMRYIREASILIIVWFSPFQLRDSLISRDDDDKLISKGFCLAEIKDMSRMK
jgi:hypothetical protein